MKNSRQQTYSPVNIATHKNKNKIKQLLFHALLILLLLILPLIYQKTAEASPLPKTSTKTTVENNTKTSLESGIKASVESNTKTSLENTFQTDKEAAPIQDNESLTKNNIQENPAQLVKKGNSLLTQDMPSQLNSRAYEYDSITNHKTRDGIAPQNNNTIGAISPVLGTAVAIVTGDILGRAAVYFENLRTSLNSVSSNFYEKIIPNIMPFELNERYTLAKSKGTGITVRSSIMSGDSIGNILTEWISMQEVLNLVEKSKEIHPLTSLRVGKPYFITIDTTSKKISRFEYEIDNTDKLIIEFAGTDHNVFKEAIPYTFELAYVEGSIKENFFNSVLAAGENANFAIKLADVFSYDIDFIREIQNDDEFYALVEKRYRDGKFTGYGRIIGAKFINNNFTHHAYLFHDATDATQLTYFDEEGKALQKAFLRTPVHFTRVSSKYSMNRKHPILGIRRPHMGIDYAAKQGTPVVAVGDGTVTRSAYTGGYGNLIVLRHAGKLESQYAHLSGYAKGIKRGAKVSQGQTIGFVGSTGLSTGPHLDFRIKKNGKFVNPDKVITPSKPPVAQEQKPLFNITIQEIEDYMTAKKKINEFDSTIWLAKTQ